MKDLDTLLKEANVIDSFIEWVMAELEYCDDKIYNENLSPAHYIDIKSRKETLIEVRDKYCGFRQSK